MNQDKIKRALCETHADLLHIILYFGGFMLLAQLRALCLAFGLYASGQAVNRAVRELREADILNRKTWVDNNSDLLLARKYAYRFFGDATSQEVATPRRPSTMTPYIAQARKIDWLLDIVQRKGLTSLDAVHRYLTHCGCTVFLRLPDLPGYYVDHYDIFTESGPEEFWEQADRLEVVTSWRASIARAEPVQKDEADPPITLDLAHRRGVYIERIFPEEKAVRLALFAGLSTRPQRIMDWVIDAHMWLKTLMPQYRSIFAVYALSDAHKAALRAGLTGTAYNRQTPYFRARLVAAHLDGEVNIAVTNTDFISRWCGNIQPTTVF